MSHNELREPIACSRGKREQAMLAARTRDQGLDMTHSYAKALTTSEKRATAPRPPKTQVCLCILPFRVSEERVRMRSLRPGSCAQVSSDW
jgi:hypothetical protein